jgi:uncharacterized protein YggT (Ycf19 family)
MGDPKITANKMVTTFIGLAELVLGIRLVFSLVNADATNSFVLWVYSMSDTLLSPFRNIMPEQAFDHSYVLEFRVLFAMAAFAVVGYLALALVGAVPNPRVKGSAWRKWLRDQLS